MSETPDPPLKERLPKHREISRALISEIGTGKFGPLGKLPSETALVQRFGVSRPTVARALRDLQAQGLIERKVGSGSYVRTQATPSLSLRKLGLLLPDRGATEILEAISGELSGLARAHDYALLFGGAAHSAPDPEQSRQHAIAMCGQFIDQQVAGVFFAPFESMHDLASTNQEIVERLSKAGIPLVLLDRDVTAFPLRSAFDLVSTDHFAGGFLLAEHLIKLGSRQIAFVARPGSAPSVDARAAGVRHAFAHHNLPAAEGWLQLGNPEDLGFVRDQLVGRGWDAVIGANDLTAAQLLRSLEKCGVQVPRHLRLAGFDDAQYSAVLGVALTTIHQPSRSIAVAAFRALTDRISAPALPARSIFLAPRLVVRESCGAYPALTSG